LLQDALATAWRNVTNIGADSVKMADVFKVPDAACIANVAAVGVAKVTDVDGPDRPAVVATGAVVNVADAAKF
jgi:hypothetical protein